MSVSSDWVLALLQRCARQPHSLAEMISDQGRRLSALWFPFLNLIWLFWMIPWYGHPRPVVMVVSYASMALFFTLARYAWFGSRAHSGYWTAGIALLSLAILPVNGSWSYVIYAALLIPFCCRGWRCIGSLALLLTAFYGIAIYAASYTPQQTLTCIIPTTCVALLSLLLRFSFERDNDLRRSQDEVRRLAVVAERERIARDLHDLLGHTLSLVAVKSELARRLLAANPVAADRELSDIEQVTRHSLVQVREAVTGMHAAGLLTELASARLMFEAGDIRFEVRMVDVELAPAAESALSLALREAVTNVQRHARATCVQVCLQRAAGLAELSVHDNGCGGVLAKGNGLTGMEARLAAVGGSLALESKPGRGTLLRMRVPPVAEVAA